MPRDRSIPWPKPFIALRNGSGAELPRDVFAGITLAAMILPLNIGYAQVAGVPPTAGLYAAIIPLVVFAIFSSSRHLVSGPDATVGAMIGAALIAVAAPGDDLRLDYTLALAILSGVLFLIFWLFRLAFLANFLSRAVLAGFVTGLAIEVFTKQVHKILGVHHEEGAEHASRLSEAAHEVHEVMASSVEATGFFLELIVLFESLPHANLYSVGIGVAAFVIVRGMKKYAPQVPGALVALVLLTLIVALFGLDKKGVSVLGELPSGLPTLTFPAVPLFDYFKLLPGALALVAILMCEGLLLSRSYASKDRYKADGNQLMFAYGAMNVAAGFTGSLISGPSPSRSAAMEASGVSSQRPSLVAAVVIAIVMLFFTKTLAYLPNAALAGIVANAVLSLIEIDEMREFWHARRSEFWVAMICLMGVLVLGPLRGVLIAFLMAVIDLLGRASRPGTWVLRESAESDHLEPVESDEGADDTGLLVYRFGASLFFANANFFSDEVERLTDGGSAIQWFILDAEAMVDMDTSGAEVMQVTLGTLELKGIAFGMSRANPPLLKQMQRYGLLDHIDPQLVFETNREALAAYRRACPPEHSREDLK